MPDKFYPELARNYYYECRVHAMMVRYLEGRVELDDEEKEDLEFCTRLHWIYSCLLSSYLSEHHKTLGEVMDGD